MALPAWIAAALAHPEVRRVGIKAATKAGSMVADRMKKNRTDVIAGDPASAAQREPVSDLALLQESIEARPTRVEIAEAIAALEAQNEARVRRLRGTFILIALGQLLVLGLAYAVLG